MTFQVSSIAGRLMEVGRNRALVILTFASPAVIQLACDSNMAGISFSLKSLGTTTTNPSWTVIFSLSLFALLLLLIV